MLLYGCGGHAKVVADCVMAQNGNVTGFFDDKPTISEHYGIKVIGTYDSNIFSEFPIVISIGNNLARKNVSKKIKHQYTKVVHPSALISPTSKIGQGSVVFQSSIIQADAILGVHVIVNTGSIVEHDCEIAEYVHVSPNATICGNVSIGEGTWVGASATVLPGVNIGAWCVIAAGSVVTENIPDYSLVMGVPGVIVKNLKSSEI